MDDGHGEAVEDGATNANTDAAATTISIDAVCPACASPLSLHASSLGLSLRCTPCAAPVSELICEPMLRRIVPSVRWDTLRRQETMATTMQTDGQRQGAGKDGGATKGGSGIAVTGLSAYASDIGSSSTDPLLSSSFLTVFDLYEASLFATHAEASASMPADALHMLEALASDEGEEGEEGTAVVVDDELATLRSAAAGESATLSSESAREELAMRLEEQAYSSRILRQNLSRFFREVAVPGSVIKQEAGPTHAPGVLVSTGSAGGAVGTVKEETLSDLEGASDVSRAASGEKGVAAALGAKVPSRVASTHASVPVKAASATTAAPSPTLTRPSTLVLQPDASLSDAAAAPFPSDDSGLDLSAEGRDAHLSQFLGLESLDNLASQDDQTMMVDVGAEVASTASSSGPAASPSSSLYPGLLPAASHFLDVSQLSMDAEHFGGVVQRAYSFSQSFLNNELANMGAEEAAAAAAAAANGSGSMGPPLPRSVSAFGFDSGVSRSESMLLQPVDGSMTRQGSLGSLAGGGGLMPASQSPQPLQPSLSLSSLPPSQPPSQPPLGSPSPQPAYVSQRLPSVLASGVPASGSAPPPHPFLPQQTLGRTHSWAKLEGRTRLATLASTGVLSHAAFALAANQHAAARAEQQSAEAQAMYQNSQPLSQSQSGVFSSDAGWPDESMGLPNLPAGDAGDGVQQPFGADGPSFSLSSLGLSGGMAHPMQHGLSLLDAGPLGSPGGGSQDMGLSFDAPTVGSTLFRSGSNEFDMASYQQQQQGQGQQPQRSPSTSTQPHLAHPIPMQHAIHMPRPIDVATVNKLARTRRGANARTERANSPTAAQSHAAADAAASSAVASLPPANGGRPARHAVSLRDNSADDALNQAVTKVMGLLSVSSALRDHLEDFCRRLCTPLTIARLAGYIGKRMQVRKVAEKRDSSSLSMAALFTAYALEGMSQKQAPFCKQLGRTEVTLRKVWYEIGTCWWELIPSRYEPKVVPKQFAARPPEALIGANAGRRKQRAVMPIRSASSSIHALHGNWQAQPESFMHGPTVPDPALSSSQPIERGPSMAGPSPADFGLAPRPSDFLSKRSSNALDAAHAAAELARRAGSLRRLWSTASLMHSVVARTLPPGFTLVQLPLHRAGWTPSTLTLQPPFTLRLHVPQCMLVDGRTIVHVRPRAPPSAPPSPAAAAAAAAKSSVRTAVQSAHPSHRYGRRTNLPLGVREVDSDCDTDVEDEAGNKQRAREGEGEGDASIMQTQRPPTHLLITQDKLKRYFK